MTVFSNIHEEYNILLLVKAIQGNNFQEAYSLKSKQNTSGNFNKPLADANIVLGNPDLPQFQSIGILLCHHSTTQKEHSKPGKINKQNLNNASFDGKCICMEAVL